MYTRKIEIQQMHHPFTFPTATPRVLRFGHWNRKECENERKQSKWTESHQISHHFHSGWLHLEFISCNNFFGLIIAGRKTSAFIFASLSPSCLRYCVVNRGEWWGGRMEGRSRRRSKQYKRIQSWKPGINISAVQISRISKYQTGWREI